MSLLDVRDLAVTRGAVETVHGITLHVEEGEVVALVGANGAGKSSALLAISGVLRSSRGSIHLDGADVTRRTSTHRTRAGLVLVPEGRGIFARMTVVDNLRAGGWSRRDRSGTGADIAAALERFPLLAARRDQPAGVLSGGEQQMLAIARALVSRPRLLLLDEPSLGLAPRLVDQVLSTVGEIRREGTAILLVEQAAVRALEIADRAYVMVAGRMALSGCARELARDPAVRAAYLGSAC